MQMQIYNLVYYTAKSHSTQYSRRKKNPGGMGEGVGVGWHFNIKMSSYQHGDPHVKDKTV